MDQNPPQDEEIHTIKSKERDEILHRYQIHLIILYLISRVLMLFTPIGFALDIQEFLLLGEGLLNGGNPYTMYPSETHNFLAIKYPPFYVLQSAGIVAIFGSRIILVRLAFILYDFGSLVVFYSFARHINRQFSLGEKWPQLSAVLIFAFFPFSVFFFLSAPHKIIGQFYFILGLYLFYKKHHIISSVVLSLGFLTEIYPIFAWLIIMVFLIARSEWKTCLMSVVGFILTAILASFYFILMDFGTAITSLSSHFSNITVAVSLWDLLPAETSGVFMLFGIVEIRIHAIVFSVYSCLFFLCSYRFWKKNPSISENSIIFVIIVYILSLSAVFLSINPMMFYWVFSLFALYTAGEFKSLFRGAIISTIVIGVNSLIANIIFPSYSFVKLLTLPYHPYWQWDFFVMLLDIISMAVLPIFWSISARELPFFTERSRIHISFPYYFAALEFLFISFYAIAAIMDPGLSSIYSIIVFVLVFAIGLTILFYIIIQVGKSELSGFLRFGTSG